MCWSFIAESGNNFLLVRRYKWEPRRQKRACLFGRTEKVQKPIESGYKKSTHPCSETERIHFETLLDHMKGQKPSSLLLRDYLTEHTHRQMDIYTATRLGLTDCLPFFHSRPTSRSFLPLRAMLKAPPVKWPPLKFNLSWPVKSPTNETRRIIPRANNDNLTSIGQINRKAAVGFLFGKTGRVTERP